MTSPSAQQINEYLVCSSLMCSIGDGLGVESKSSDCFVSKFRDAGFKLGAG